MPRLSQLMIRTALVWLALGFSAGGLVLLNKGLVVLPWLWALRGSHIHMLLVGWVVQLACGVAYWILPRLDAQGTRGDERVVWGCYLALNVGATLGAVAGPLALVPVAARFATATLIAAGTLDFVGALLFLSNAWPRVVPFRTLPRPPRPPDA